MIKGDPSDVGKQTVQTERLEKHHHVKHEQPQREAEAQPNHCADERHTRTLAVIDPVEAVPCVEPEEHTEPHGDVLQRDEGDDERSPAWMARFEEVQGEEDVE